MSSLAPSKRERPTNALPSKTGLLSWIQPLLSSTVGSKFLVAITGILLIGFVIAHLVGNLKVFAGRDSLNSYAAFLKSLGPLLWVARIGLLVVFLVHIRLALKLKARSLAARPVGYHHTNTIQATLASRTMVLTGLTILAFVVYHVCHYTLGIVGTGPDGQKLLDLKDPMDPSRHDVYQMVIYGFTNPLVSIVYLVAQLLLMVHLSHGIASVFQTLGLNTPRTNGAIRCLGWLISLAIFVGNSAIVIAVWTGYVHA